MREIEITGPVKRISLDAFEGIDSYELLVTLRDTEISELPDGFAQMFANVAHFSLDLRNNKMERMSPEVLYRNGSDWERIGTRILQGPDFHFHPFSFVELTNHLCFEPKPKLKKSLGPKASFKFSIKTWLFGKPQPTGLPRQLI